MCCIVLGYLILEGQPATCCKQFFQNKKSFVGCKGSSHVFTHKCPASAAADRYLFAHMFKHQGENSKKTSENQAEM
jgi:hypothetical protein